MQLSALFGIVGRKRASGGGNKNDERIPVFRSSLAWKHFVELFSEKEKEKWSGRIEWCFADFYIGVRFENQLINQRFEGLIFLNQ